jgi:hypothetical protein
VTPVRAFGLDLDSRVELAGFEAEAGAGGGARPVRLELATAAELAERGRGAPAERIAEAAGPDGRPVAVIDAIAGRGYSAWAEGFGRGWIDADGAAIACAPVDGPAWRWQRFLIGQLLPFAAVLRGLEVFHASAVVVGGRAVAIVAGSGAGKTSLALELVLRGLPFLNDDVLVVEQEAGGGLAAHPGAPLANVRRDGGSLAERLAAAGLGRELGTSGEETRLAVARHPEAVPLGAVFFLRRVGAAGRAAIERIAPVDPRLLLASTFNRALRPPERLARQLDVCGRAADSADMFRVDAPPGVAPANLAAQIHDSALEQLAAK